MNFHFITTIAFLLFVKDNTCKSVSSLSNMNCSINILREKDSTIIKDDIIDLIFDKITSLAKYSTISYLLGNYLTEKKQSQYTTELFLRNRWKSARWRFCLSVLIFSENLPFITESLKVYGPNMSHHSNIFVIYPKQKSENHHYIDISKFQRDVAFGKLYSPLTLVNYGGEKRENGNKIANISFQVVCPLCPDALEPSPVIATEEIFLNLDTLTDLLKSLQIVHKFYNWDKGHGSIAWLCRIGYRNAINENDPEYHKRVEYTARWNFDRNSSKNGIILGILMNLFNFTIQMEVPGLDGREEGNYSGIYLSPGGDIPTFHIYGRNIIHSHDLNEFFLYCRKFVITPSTGWDFFSSPFDLITWILIATTGILYVVLHRGKFSYGFDIFWSVIGIPCQSDWKKSKFLSYFLVILINLNTGYLSVITSKVIIPNREVDIETPTELFKQGYRFINKNATIAAPGFIGYYRRDLQKFHIDDTIESNIIVTVDNCVQTHNPLCISQWAGLATGLLYLNEKAERLLEVPADKRDKCHGVKIPFRKYWVTFYSQGPLSPRIYQLHQQIIATGIDVFWDKLHATGAVYDAYRKANHSAKRSDHPTSLNFDTPVLLVFKAYGLLVCTCLFTFAAEVLVGNTAKNIGNRVVPISSFK